MPMLTASGQLFDPTCLAAGGLADTVCLSDIAHSLAHICRFVGHCKRHYSVAEHSLFVADILKRQGYPAAAQFAGLMHDAHEAYCGDVVTPIKEAIGPAWRHLEDGIERTVHSALGISALMAKWKSPVHRADSCALVTEIRSLFLTPTDAEARIRALGLEHVDPVDDNLLLALASPGAGYARRFLERYHALRQGLLNHRTASRRGT